MYLKVHIVKQATVHSLQKISGNSCKDAGIKCLLIVQKGINTTWTFQKSECCCGYVCRFINMKNLGLFN